MAVETHSAGVGFIEFVATDPSSQYKLAVAFDAGFVNQKGILNQCESVDAYLDAVYQARFARYETGKGQYPYTSVTNDGFQPGFLGGKSTTVTISNVEAYQKPYTNVIYMNAVPREGGIYLATFAHPSEAMETSEPVRRHFLHSIWFSAGARDEKAYCNY